MSTNTGGPAFPGTLLDWYAGQALAGLISKLPVIDQTGEFGVKVDDKIAYNRDVADSCYAMAEAMLAEKARREAVVKESSTTPDATKMAELQAANRELAEALEWVVKTIKTTADHKSKVALSVILREVRIIPAKHKGAA